ncbi:uncharacterized protein N7529_005716 [Penicillium soppii]|uniref:uncharacterized protein n=1 Tax=Penicillium soppii TaxID=69789 RepID=UPI0025478DE0|nr:uncharacterized protein N7529_005716 [Penicillium soppii]KAJ5863800.1 hypothetical protein N7529_005716 [Penicillium soppii]
MAKAYQKIQKSQQHPGSRAQINIALDDSFLSQHDHDLSNRSPEDAISQSLFSQAPYNLHGVPKHQDHPNVNRVSLGNSKELLARLAGLDSIPNNPNPKNISNFPGTSLDLDNCRQSPLKIDKTSMVQVHNSNLSRELRGKRLSGQGLLKRTSVPHASSSILDSTRADISQGADGLEEQQVKRPGHSTTKAADDDTIRKVAGGESPQPSKKRHRDSTDVQSQTSRNDDLQSDDAQTAKSTSPSNKRQRTDAGESVPADSPETELSPNERMFTFPGVQIIGTKSVRTPMMKYWEGMTTIPASEVNIPKDQVKLLGELKWIPQDPGVSERLCHVPPDLLSRWNKIAQRRQHWAEKQEQIHDRPLTPTPQGTNPSVNGSQSVGTPVSEWEPSEPSYSPRNILPPDSSPTRKGADHATPIRAGTQDSGGQFQASRDVDTGNEIQIVSQTQTIRPNFVDSRDVPNEISEHISQPLNEESMKSRGHEFPVPVAGSNLFQTLDRSRSADVKQKEHDPSSTQKGLHDQSGPGNKLDVSKPHDEQSGDESDESNYDEMETSVPYALGENFPLSSQPEQEMSSSGPSLPKFIGANIQVVETPVVKTTRRRCEKQNEEQVRYEIPSSSSQGDVTSSSSRVLNTHHSQDSHRQSGLSQEAPNPSLPEPENDSLRVDVLGTQTQISSMQTSSIHAPSQATLQSSSDVVLDSSRPVQRQRGSSIFRLEPSDHPSSLPYASPHPPALSRPNEPRQDFTREHFTPEGAWQLLGSPSKAPRSLSGNDPAAQKPSHTPDVELVARRQGFIGKDNRSAEAQRIYEKFRNAYSPYSGDFTHFTNMCSKLRTIREKGILWRSFLWDDFIILSLEEYPRYLEQHADQDPETLDYGEFFCSKFSRPRYKKRSLTANEIEVAASQVVPPPMASPESPPNPSQLVIKTEAKEENQNELLQGEGANISFTASLVDKFSDLRARSLGFTSNVDQKPTVAELDTEMVVSTQSDANSIHSTSHQSDIDMAEDDVPEIDETQEADYSHHETASIELGDDVDDRHVSHSSALDPTASSADYCDPEPPRQRERRPWFRSLKNIFPTGPVWSDDPNTPFKRWARQDQNLLQEINRRGGTKVTLDEKGVIRRPTYNRGAKSTQGL